MTAWGRRQAAAISDATEARRQRLSAWLTEAVRRRREQLRRWRLQARALLLEGWARDFMSHVPSKNAKDRAADKAAQLSADVSRQAARVQSMQSI